MKNCILNGSFDYLIPYFGLFSSSIEISAIYDQKTDTKFLSIIGCGIIKKEPLHKGY